MADSAGALCGPSNALQSFGKHVQLDRTLQQDRLVSSQQPQQQGFRTRDPRAGSLDAELLAFEHGGGGGGGSHAHTPPPLLQQHQMKGGGGSMQMPAAARQQQAGWAADFQRLHISQTPSPGPGPVVAPIPVQRFRAEAPLVRNAGGWGAEFMRAQQQQGQQQMGLGKGKEVESASLLGQQQQGYGFMSGAGGVGLGMGMGMGMDMGYGMQQQQPQMAGMEMAQHHQQQDGQVSQADFDAAFEEAMMEVEREQQAQEQEQQQLREQQHQDSTIIDDQEASVLPETALEKSDIRIGSDTIDYVEQQARTNRTPDQEQRDADELARTAGQLLTLVQHDTSAKFQNSQFLDLMRRIRDREVEVLDNDLQATGPESQVRAEPPLTAHPQQQADDMRPHDPNQFSFPSLNDVYAPTAADLDSQGADTFDPASLQQRQGPPPPAGSWQQNPPMQAMPGSGSASDADAMYTSTADEYPQSELHPGGRFYPEMSPRMSGARMSGFEGGNERTA